MSPFSIVLASCLATAPLMVMADGLTAPAGGLGGAGWQARMELDSSLPSSLGGLSGFTTVTPSGLQTARLLGDYRHVVALAPDLQLLYRRRPERIAGREHHLEAVVL